MSVKSALIDFDGTLANTNGAIIKSFQHTFRTFLGHEIEVSEIEKNFGEPLRITMERLFGEKHGEEAMNVYRSFQSGRFANLIHPFPGMKDLVQELKAQGYQTALVTSRLRESAIEGITRFGLMEYFDVITTIDNITRHKPDPEAIEVTLKALHATPEEAVMIGDSKFDMLCAKNAGCRSILVDWSVTGEEERIRLGADFIAKNANAILKWINEN